MAMATTEKMRFPTIIHKDAGSDYGDTVSDLPGCFTAGTSTDEALEYVAAQSE